MGTESRNSLRTGSAEADGGSLSAVDARGRCDKPGLEELGGTAATAHAANSSRICFGHK